MSSDFRVKSSAFDNIKLKRVKNKLGDEGLLSLITLWSYVAREKPTGLLGKCSAEEIELMAGWGGEPQAFLKAVKEAKLLDHDRSNGYAIHDWDVHNPYLATGTGQNQPSVVDFRLDTGLFRHRKIVNLKQQLGAEGVVSLIRLYAYVSVYRSDGRLTSMDSTDVAAAAEYSGDSVGFVRSLLETYLLDRPDWAIPPEDEQDDCSGPYSIHDWEQWNPYRFYAKLRSNIARNAAQRRWNASPTSKNQVLSSPPSSPAIPKPMNQGQDGIIKASTDMK